MSPIIPFLACLFLISPALSIGSNGSCVIKQELAFDDCLDNEKANMKSRKVSVNFNISEVKEIDDIGATIRLNMRVSMTWNEERITKMKERLEKAMTSKQDLDEDEQKRLEDFKKHRFLTADQLDKIWKPEIQVRIFNGASFQFLSDC